LTNVVVIHLLYNL